MSGDASIAEKRVYAGGSARSAFVASAAGLARVSVSGDCAGEFGLAVRESARDVAAAGGRVAAASETDVLVGTDDGFAATEFGPATAVGVADGVVACGDGRVARREDGAWTDLGRVADVRAVAGDLLAAAGGVHRLDGSHVGLTDARDVAVGERVLAATGDGLYALANGWMKRLDDGIRAVAVGAGRAVAVADDGTLYERRGDGWTDADAPGGVVDAAPTADALYAVTADGTFLAAAGDGWRDRSLGLAGCRRLAVADEP